jgi:3-hydroxy-D-aspartate aldolase
MGGNRCGVEPGEPALELARHVAGAPHLAFAGLKAFHGSAQHLRGIISTTVDQARFLVNDTFAPQSHISH